MMQTTITSYFNKRKRGSEETINNPKILISNEDRSLPIHKENEMSFPVSKKRCVEVKNPMCEVQTESHEKEKRVFDCGETSQSDGYVTKPPASSTSKILKLSIHTPKGHRDIRSAFQPKDLNDTGNFTTKPLTAETAERIVSGEGQNTVSGEGSESVNKVTFLLLGGLSMKSKKMDVQNECNQSPVSETVNPRMELGLVTPKKRPAQPKHEIAANEIKQKICRSSRIEELRRIIRSYNQKDDELKEPEKEEQKLVFKSPRLKEFNSIDVMVDMSPRKSTVSTPVGSPLKSPLKSPFASPAKLDAYRRLGYFAQPDVPDLSLPLSYRILAEIFRCTDTATSMFYNRNEVVTFRKLRGAVQEMSRRKFFECHLGQIKRVNPKAFTFMREKCTTSGSTETEFDLVVIPVLEKQASEVLETSNDSCHPMMTSSVLVKRREEFNNCLLEMVKDYHENFLKTLDPPLIVPRSKICRWHPKFDLEQIPPVEADELTEAPGQETGLLTPPRDISFSQGMEGAGRGDGGLMATPSKSDAPSSDANDGLTTSALLKDVPKTLLEKIRAKEAARALISMTRTPEERLELERLERLPDVARVMWNIFVAEKKNVLMLETVVRKLGDSCRGKVSHKDLEQDVRLILKMVPDFLEIHYVRYCDYLRLPKSCDISAIVKKLEDLCDEKKEDF